MYVGPSTCNSYTSALGSGQQVVLMVLAPWTPVSTTWFLVPGSQLHLLQPLENSQEAVHGEREAYRYGGEVPRTSAGPIILIQPKATGTDLT